MDFNGERNCESRTLPRFSLGNGNVSRMLNGRIFGWKDCIGNFTQGARLSGKVVQARNKTDRNGSILKYINISTYETRSDYIAILTEIPRNM